MSLTQYTDYTGARTNLNNETANVSTALLSTAADPIAVCITDFTQKNVWFIEVIGSSVDSNEVTIKGPGIHLVFESAFADAQKWVGLLNAWNGQTSSDLVNAMNAKSLGVSFRNLCKCEIRGSFKKGNTSNVFTLNGVLKNNTIKTDDDNIIVAMDPSTATKVGALVTFLTTSNEVVRQVANNISFLNGATAAGLLAKTPITNINE